MIRFKKKAFSGAIWKFIERISAQVVSTVVSIVLARILSPEHYGTIAIVNVFITLCNVFVVTGLGESLVQKKNADELDFSSIFYVNLLLSILLYAILFFAAPLITAFYGDEYENLTLIIRVMGLHLIFAAINSIQSAVVSKQMAFKKFFWVTLIGTVSSAAVGIGMALSGCGVWALVAQYMTNAVVNTIMLFLFIRWRPRLIFSINRVKSLFSYGWKILANAILNTFYNESRSLVIGKKYSAEDLAFYNKGSTYPKLIVNNLNSALGTVLFPVLVQSQDHTDVLKQLLRRSMTLTCYIVFPCMVGLALVAEDFVRLLLTEKWLPCVPYLRAICIIYAIQPMSTLNLQCLSAIGQSGRVLKLGIYKKILGFVLLIVSFWFGLSWIVATYVISIALEYVIDTAVMRKNIKYGLFAQLFDLKWTLFAVGGMGITTWLANTFVCGQMSAFPRMATSIVIAVVVYVAISAATKNDAFCYLVRKIKRK